MLSFKDISSKARVFHDEAKQRGDSGGYSKLASFMSDIEVQSREELQAHTSCDIKPHCSEVKNQC